MKRVNLILLILIIFASCDQNNNQKEKKQRSDTQKNLDQYVEVKLVSDINVLSESEKQVLPLLVEVADIMDKIFWYEAIGNRDTLCNQFLDSTNRKLFDINYGPWDRLNGNIPFVKCLGEKPLGANFYPIDITRDEFDKFSDKQKNSPYTFIRRKDDRSLEVIPYHVALNELVQRASDLLLQASQIIDHEGLKKYFLLKSKAFLTDDYFASDTTWLTLKNNNLDFIAGPTDIYEDRFFNIKAEHQAYLLVKSKEWTDKVLKYTMMLRFLQKALPVPEQYRQEEPGENSEIAIYDVIYYGGSGKAGGAIMSANFPFDQMVQKVKGTKNIQFRNTIKAKFDNIIVPISDGLIAKNQRKYIHSEAYFSNILFFDMALCLGIHNTLTGKGTVREALRENFTVLELAKARVLGLFFLQKLHEVKEVKNDLIENYLTFISDIFRSVRFGASSPHAQANLLCFNYFRENGAILFEDGRYSINEKQMIKSVESLANIIITIEGDGNYNAAKKILDEKAVLTPELKKVIEIINSSEIPIDITFKQGLDVIGL